MGNLMNKEIFTTNNYGHIEIDIKTLMDAQRISRNALARMIGTRFEVVNKWYNGSVEKIDADILARICFVLDCSPADVIVYKK